MSSLPLCLQNMSSTLYSDISAIRLNGLHVDVIILLNLFRCGCSVLKMSHFVRLEFLVPLLSAKYLATIYVMGIYSNSVKTLRYIGRYDVSEHDFWWLQGGREIELWKSAKITNISLSKESAVFRSGNWHHNCFRPAAQFWSAYSSNLFGSFELSCRSISKSAVQSCGWLLG